MSGQDTYTHLLLTGATSPRDEGNRARLRRMKWFATVLLLAMLSIVALTSIFGSAHPAMGWVHAFAEAAVVGALADWFAVTALFRHPLGLPIPHTAIIPRNKDEIGESLGQFVELNFLTPENVIRRLEQQNLALAGAQWLAAPGRARTIAENICAELSAVMDRLDDADVRRFLDSVVVPLVERIDVARASGEILDLLTAGNRHQALLDRALSSLNDWLNRNRPRIQEAVHAASKFMPAFIDNFIANRFIDGILELTDEVARNPAHELRAEFDLAVHELTHNLKHSAEYQKRGEDIKHDVLEHLRSEPYYKYLWSEFKERIQADLVASDSLIRSQIESGLRRTAHAIEIAPPLQAKINRWTVTALEKVMLRHRHEVSQLITDVVRSWNAAEVAKRVELEIGKDLQFIRINGTLVGGLAGLLLYAVARLAG
jgi:uncharacterized membrane-anchored protein YjiN (DUF445 family)